MARIRVVRSVWVGLLLGWLVIHAAAAAEPRPNVLIVSVDTLRVDRLSSYGYERPTSPNIDRLIASGVKFAQARTVEPLTSPSMCSVVTSLYPHEHGSSRNGLRMREGLSSLPKILSAEGYSTAGFVSNWTLRNKLSGLGEHFDAYEEVLTRKRWWGLIKGEASAEDINREALSWLDEHLGETDAPFLMWVHYTEPHAPYILHDEFVEELGLLEAAEGNTQNATNKTKKKNKKTRKHKKLKLSPADRYDTEIAFVDHWIGELVDEIAERVPGEDTLIAFVSDHGESLGEHKYWGHGRHLYEPTLHIPMSLTWTSRVEPLTIEAPALTIDVAPTILGLLDIEHAAEFQGFDWTPVLRGAAQPLDRVTQYQAHRGAVLSGHDSELARRSGLISVAVLEGGRKEIFRVKNGRHWSFDLRSDPKEVTDLAQSESDPPELLRLWMSLVSSGLDDLDELPPEPLDDDTVERLRALGYAD